MDWIAISTAIPNIGDIMFWRGDDTLIFKAFAEGNSHTSSEKRIFAIRFFDPAPANVTGDIHHRGENLADAPTFRLPGDGCGEDLAYWLSDEPWVPKNPPKPGEPPKVVKKRPMALAALPNDCRSVLTAN